MNKKTAIKLFLFGFIIQTITAVIINRISHSLSFTGIAGTVVIGGIIVSSFSLYSLFSNMSKNAGIVKKDSLERCFSLRL